MNTEKELIKKRGGVKAKLTQFSTYLNIAKSSDKLIGARGASGRRRGAIQRAEPARGPVIRAGVAGYLLEGQLDPAHNQVGPVSANCDTHACATNRQHLVNLPKVDLIPFAAMVMVGDRHGRLHKARLLLDNGSTANFVTDRLCTKLGLVRLDTSSTVTGIDNQATEERECEASFSEHTSRNADGRFVVTIPLKESPDVLGDSYNMARRRFMSLEKRFERDPVLKEHYTKFMQEYIDLGHITENTINVPQDNKVSYYIPHHGLFQPKCRVVFDAGAASTSGKSFNDIQKIGPTVQDDLFSILVRFRQHKYVVTADVEKMYRAIEVNPSQRSLQQIIYRSEPYLPLKTYTLNTLTYGCSSAPYLATKCLVSLADQVQDDKVKYAIQRNFYVDDYLDGDDSIEKLKHTCQQVISTLDSAKLNLRKWQSNSTDILQTVMDLKGTPLNNKSLDLNENTSCKTLGLYWSCSQDMLLFSINLKHNPNSKVTKRHILSTINQIFDPLGLVGPCVMEVKDIMRKLWSAKYDWDDEVSVEIKNLWHTFEDTLPKINNLLIPRWILCDEPSSIELHTFTDASERAYGTCIYARTVGKNGTVDVHLLVSKNKIAPIKPTTIPRLELSGALMGSRLCTKVKSALTVNAQCFFWSDSTIVLGWLSSPTNQLKQFVRNRVYEIQESTSGHKWSYVPSKDNPADLVSRGMRADAIGESSLWWSGPSFLSKPCCDWPVMPNVKEQSLPEIVLFSNAEDSHKIPNPIANLIHNRSMKAVHIELVTELTKEAFMAALSRFIARRGRPQNIHSDQGTSFVGASNELQRFLKDTSDDISGQLADDGIKFNFIPPYTPHFGGLWEAAVKSVKFHLRRVLGLAHLTYEEMSTCLSQIEAILNSRPLTPLPSDPSNDFTALTPAHFLIGRSLMSVPHPQVTDANIKLLPRYQRVEQIRQHFWNRFSNEYLSLLQQKTKWHRSTPEQLTEGTLVLVKDRTMPPLLWPLGRIIKVHPGTDGITRVVDVLTKKGTTQRAYNNICPLPTS
ncbi:unnamed protein product [Plutella xylostella]|uniref:(diamondback moth) hypothetical protein n=1 Tax=Plutella xylostella TaxID=51655 RepID=A0A8S4FQE8_PLUXY|nr:unnamed protein product [Plutella xylostella]